MRLFALGLVLLLAGGGPAGSSPPRVVTPVGETGDAAGFTFRVDTPSLQTTRNPDGTVEVAIDGFRVRERRPGVPDLPTRLVLVAIPPDSVPRLEVREVVEEAMTWARPRAVARERADFDESSRGARGEESRLRRHREFVEDPSVYAGAGLFPRKIARLGEIGKLRNQRYVEVHIAPVRYSPESGGLRVARSFEVEVVFDGWEPSRARPLSEPRFEGLYREAFVNYSQGRSFRTSVAIAPQEVTELANTRSGGVDDPSARAKIRIDAHGVVRLDHALMAGTDFIAEPLSTWKLTNRGVEVPLHVMDDDGDGMPEASDGNDMLDPGEWVQFWGQRLDDEPKALLNADLGGEIDIWQANDFTDENVYFLTIESGPRTRMGVADALPTHSRVPPADFEAVAHQEIDEAWRPLGGADPWYWGPTLFDDGANWRRDAVTLTGLASGSDEVRVRVHLQGRSEDVSVFPDHTTRVTLEDAGQQVLAIDNDDGTFDGRTLYLHDFVFTPSGSQVTPTVNVKLEALSNAAPSNDVILDWIEIVYRRAFSAVGDVLVFDWPDEDAEFVISGLAGDALEVYELTGRIGASGVVDAVRLIEVEVTGAGPYQARFRVDNDPGLADGAARRFVVAGDAGVTVPSLEADVVSDLRDESIQADLIVIAHPDLLDDPQNCADVELGQLLGFRLGQGVTSQVACIEDVQDEFNAGLPGPSAIRSFLTWVMSDLPGEGWADPKPSYVLLLGDSSYDYKAGTANGTYVPTQIMFKDDPAIGYYSSDSILAAVVGTDRFPDLTVGRVSVRTETMADDVLLKLLDYEQSSAGGNWLGNALILADRGKGYDTLEASEFERISDIAADAVTEAGQNARKMYYWSGIDYCNGTPGSCNPAVFKNDLKANLNGDDAAFDSAAMMQFVGHGNFDLWSDDVLFCSNEASPFCVADDTQDLHNGVRLPWLVVHNCLTGGFHGLGAKSSGEQWLRRAGGGAVAVYSPSGLGFRYIGEDVTDWLWNDVYGGAKNRDLGMVALNTQVMLCGQNSIEACQYYILLGDPSTTLQIPAPAPASGLSAVAGNAVVDLSWTASPEETEHRVYRSRWASGPYGRIDGSGVICPLSGACAFSDTTAENARSYYYYVVSATPGGFEGPWSNFNTDCDGGPDCVTATPLNPGPPEVPTGLTVADPETGGRLELGWSANSETDLASYTIHYGTESGVYDSSVNAGKNTSFQLTNLVDGQEYFIALTATNTSGHTSAHSIERSGVPTLILGLKSPAFISDLHVDRSGNDAVLTWGEVVTDLYGKSASIDFYEVYRGTSPTFVPLPGTLLGTAATPGYTDVDALLPGEPDYYYLVRAVDADGNGGGLGQQLPDGIRELAVDRAGDCSLTTTQTCRADVDCPGEESCVLTPDELLISWPAVGTDFDGNPLAIDHYELYIWDEPFTRDAIRDGLVGPPTQVSGTSLRITATGAPWHYSLIAVDWRGNESPF
jgi:hypothetical protein